MSMRRAIGGYRIADTMRGDTLQRISARELGDAARWVDLAALNGLIPPYIADSPGDIVPGVLLSGASIRIPTSTVANVQDESSDDAFGTDVLLARGRLVPDADGGLALVSGVENLKQAMVSVLGAEPGDLLFHADYGCGARAFIGGANTAANALVAGSLVKRAILADPRIESIRSATVSIAGDSMPIEVTAMAINSVPVSVEA